MPGSSRIINSSYSLFSGEFNLKASIAADDYVNIVTGLEKYSRNNMYRYDVIDGHVDALHFRVFCIWWDEEEERVVLAYDAFKNGRWGVKTRTDCILITQNSEGEYFLHICFYC